MNRSSLMLHALLIAAASTAAAQEPADTAHLADIVVTATHVPMAAGAIAATVTVIDGDDLRARGVRLVLDALREVPGLFVVQGGSFGAATSLFARGGESNYVKVLIDGVPANLPGGAFDFATLATVNIERIEVVRGPASVVHGSDAVSGVVQIITRRGAGSSSASITAQAGTFGSTAFDASIAGGSERLSGSLALARFGTAGIYRFNSDFDNTTLSARIAARPDVRTDLSIAARSGANTFRFPTDGSGVPSDSNQFSRGHLVSIGAEAGRRLSDRVGARLVLTSAHTDYEFEDRSDHPADTMGFGYAGERRSDVMRRSAEARINFRPVGAVTLTVGAQQEWQHEQQTGSFTSNFGGGPSVDQQVPFDRTRSNRAYYLQGIVEPAAAVSLNAGVRLDDNEAFGTFGTYRAGAAYRLSPGTRVRASMGTAFKAPSFPENFAATPFERGDVSLEPERTRSWEVGVEQSLVRDVLTVSAVYFDQRFRNLIQYVATDPPVPTYANLGAATARGVEAGIELRPLAGLSFGAAYTRLATEVIDAGALESPEFSTGARLLRRPAHTARLSASYRIAGRGSFSASTTLVGTRDDFDFGAWARVVLPSYQIVELSGELDLIRSGSGPGIALLVRAENLFNAEYQPIVGFRGRGRTLFAGARIAYGP